jgi:hypothetical protein
MPKQCHLAISSRMTGVAMCLALGAEPLLDQEGGEKKNERKYTHTHTHTTIFLKRENSPRPVSLRSWNPYEMKRRDDLVFLGRSNNDGRRDRSFTFRTTLAL